MSVSSPHAEIISTLTELYTLLSTCGVIGPALLVHSDPATGLHPTNTIASSAALAAGFSQEVVDLLHALPYLDVSDLEIFFELQPNTFPITYRGELTQVEFESRREMLNDQVIMPSALKLTRNELYGFEFIYDVKTKLVTPWNLMDTPLDKTYLDVPGKPPREAFGDMIENYRSLNYIGTPDGVDFNSDFWSESDGKPPMHYREVEVQKWLAGYDVWIATRGIKDIYLDCGWDVKAREQIDFRRDEFIRKRDEYWENTVKPLAEREAEL